MPFAKNYPYDYDGLMVEGFGVIADTPELEGEIDELKVTEGVLYARQGKTWLKETPTGWAVAFTL